GDFRQRLDRLPEVLQELLFLVFAVLDGAEDAFDGVDNLLARMAPGVAGGGRPRDGIGNRLKHGAISSRDWCTHAVPPFHAVASIWGRPLRPGWRGRGDDGVFVGQDR